jgi:F-type H+-transporting ATPase subunit delta
MRQPKVAKRYAKALFDLALETGQLEKVKDDIQTILSVDHAEFNAVMMSPVITGDKKEKIFAAVFGGKITELTKSFFNLLFKKGREIAVKEILQAYGSLYRQHHKISIVEIITAAPVSETVNVVLREKLKGLPRFKDAMLEVTNKVDDKLIGGFVLNVEDMTYDASIRHDLVVIKKQFIENMYVQKLR